MAQAEEALKRLTDFLARLETLPGAGPNRERRRRSCEEARHGLPRRTSPPT